MTCSNCIRRRVWDTDLEEYAFQVTYCDTCRRANNPKRGPKFDLVGLRPVDDTPRIRATGIPLVDYAIAKGEVEPL